MTDGGGKTGKRQMVDMKKERKKKEKDDEGKENIKWV